jgi:glutamine amidotransferase
VGETDSERAFCHILETLRRLFPDGEPGDDAIFEALSDLAPAIARHGVFNFLLSNGSALYAHCSTNLFYLTRKAPFGPAHLVDQDVSIDFNDVTTPNDRVTVIATLPLTDNETWTRLGEGQLLQFEQGQARTGF